MAEEISKDGIEILTTTEIVDNIINGGTNYAGLKAIFGDDTNFDQDSPDAQLVNIFAQAKRDLSELAVEIFNSFDPDQASGAVLDARVLYNGVIRKGGTYTITEITITTNKAVTLKGIDYAQTDEEIQQNGVFTIQDYNGNQYYLQKTTTLGEGITTGINFRAKTMGPVWYMPNAINQIVTPIKGVISVNNPRQPMQTGVAQETDDELKLRRARAVGLGMLGSVEVMQASLRQLTDVVDSVVFENNTNYTDADGIPAHSIWVIVRGGTKEEIADVIYLRLNAGCGMKGDTVVPVRRVYESEFDAQFDFAQKENLSIRLTAEPINGVDVMDPEVLADYIAQNYNFLIYQPATSTEVDKICRDYNSDFSYSDIEISSDPNTRGKIKTTTLDVDNFKGLTAGSLKITLDGTTTAQVNGLNFPADTDDYTLSLVDVALIIAKAFEDAGINATADSDGTTITLYSKKRGTGSSIAVESLPDSYEDLSSSNYLDAENMTYTQGIAATAGYLQCNELNETRLTALRAVTNGSLTITVNGGTQLAVKDLDFSNCTAVVDVVNLLNTAFANVGADCYADYTGLAVYIISNKFGIDSTIAVTSGSTGTNVVTATLLINPSTAPVAGINGTNGTATTGVLDYTDFTSVTNGALNIRVNGANAVTVENINLSQVTSVVEIANILNARFAQQSILATVTADDDVLIFTSNIAGDGSTIGFTAYTGGNVDLSTASYLNKATMTATSGVSPVNWTTLLFPELKKNYFEVEPDYITVTIPSDE